MLESPKREGQFASSDRPLGLSRRLKSGVELKSALSNYLRFFAARIIDYCYHLAYNLTLRYFP
jgi:hypothetical protein